MRGNATMRDVNGQDICGYRRKLLSMRARSYITIEGPSGTMVVATVERHIEFSLKRSIPYADIFIHNPPMSIDDVTTSGLPVSIHVFESKFSKTYDFMMGNLDNNPYKIAQVAQIAHNQRPQYTRDNGYFVEIGSNVDFAFICICAHAINNLVSNDERRADSDSD